MIENSLSMIAGHNIWQSIVFFLIVGVIFKIIKSSSAEERSWSWTATLFGLALLPLATFMPGEGMTSILFNQQKEATQIESLTSTAVAVFEPNKAILQDPATIRQLPQTKVINFLPWLLLLWGAGTVYGLILLSRASYNAYALRKNASPYKNVPVNWPTGLEVAISDEIDGPMVIGIIKPLVLIPVKFVDEMDIETLNPLLFHELAHIKRHDNILNLAERLILTLYWWNPLMRIIANRISLERELACDDRAALSCGDQVIYAKSLLMGAKKIIGRDQAILGLAAYEFKSPLAKRIMRLTDASSFKSVNFKRLVRKLSILLIAFIGLGLATPRFIIAGVAAEIQDVEFNEIEIELDEAEIAEIEYEINNLENEFNEIEFDIDIDIEQIKEDVREAMSEIRSDIHMEKIKAEVQDALKEMPTKAEIAQIAMEIRAALEDLPSMIDEAEIQKTIEEAIANIEIEIDYEKIEKDMNEALANLEIDEEQMAIDIEEALKNIPTKEEIAEMKRNIKESLENLKAERDQLKAQKEKNK